MSRRIRTVLLAGLCLWIASSAQAQDYDRWIPPFNGKDLSGWKRHPKQPGQWRVETDTLVGSGDAVSHLFSERGDFGSFHLRVEAKINATGNSGVFFRSEDGLSRGGTYEVREARPAQVQAQAQPQPDYNLPPTYGSVELKADFQPDPFVKELVAGGELHTNLGGVSAFVARAPDFSLHYTAGRFPLTIHVKSVGDTTLLINRPDCTWVADDDSGGDLDPLIRFDKPQSGRYDIYVGSYRPELVAATLYITECDVNTQPLPISEKLPACYIVSAGIDNYRDQGKLGGCLNDARNTIGAYRGQIGARFSKVEPKLLLDGKATGANILKHWRDLQHRGKAGDHTVLFLSGHGGRDGQKWFFVPYEGGLSDRQILDAADALARQKKHACIVVDACFCGQLRETARPYLERYRDPAGGSLTVMLSSSAGQMSYCMGNYSAFAKAFTDGVKGAADQNHDGRVTLGELRDYSLGRTMELLKNSRVDQAQDAVIDWSPSLTRATPFALVPKEVAKAPPRKPPAGTPQRWAGAEELAGYGKIAFALYPDGRAVMTDVKETRDGVWRKADKRYTLSFNDGAIVYMGIVDSDTLKGMAMSPAPRTQEMRSWSWQVRRQ
jgi:hypothetical protein